MSTEQEDIEDAAQALVAKPLSLVVYGAWLACKFVWKASVSLATSLWHSFPRSSARFQ